MNALFLKVHIHAELFQHTSMQQAINGISRKPGYGFGDNHIHLSLFAEPYHFVEFISLFYARSGNALICEDSDETPIPLGIYLFCIVGFLCFITVELFFLLGRYSAVGHHTLLTELIFDLLLRANRRRDNANHFFRLFCYCRHNYLRFGFLVYWLGRFPSFRPYIAVSPLLSVRTGRDSWLSAVRHL